MKPEPTGSRYQPADLREDTFEKTTDAYMSAPVGIIQADFLGILDFVPV